MSKRDITSDVSIQVRLSCQMTTVLSQVYHCVYHFANRKSFNVFRADHTPCLMMTYDVSHYRSTTYSKAIVSGNCNRQCDVSYFLLTWIANVSNLNTNQCPPTCQLAIAFNPLQVLIPALISGDTTTGNISHHGHDVTSTHLDIGKLMPSVYSCSGGNPFHSKSAKVVSGFTRVRFNSSEIDLSSVRLACMTV